MMKTVTRLQFFLIITLMAFIFCGALSSPSFAQETKDHKAFLLNVLEHAKKGMVPDCEFEVGKNKKEEVIDTWGHPALKFPLCYKEKKICFFFNFFDNTIDSIAVMANFLTVEEIKSALGEPKAEIKDGDNIVSIDYVAGRFLLKFDFESGTSIMVQNTN